MSGLGLRVEYDAFDRAISVIAHLKAGLIEPLHRLAEDVLEEEARSLATASPVDTGALQAGWQTAAEGDGVFVLFNPLFYAKFVIEGTGAMREAGVVNPMWPGMHPNQRLRAEWLNAPDRIERAILARVPSLFRLDSLAA